MLRKYLFNIHLSVLYNNVTDLAPFSTAAQDKSHPVGPLPIKTTFLSLKIE